MEASINGTTSALISFPARSHNMAIEVSVVSVGAVLLVVLLLIVLSCISDRRDKSGEHKGSKFT